LTAALKGKSILNKDKCRKAISTTFRFYFIMKCLKCKFTL
jgi:hypothetical protein